MKYPRTAASFCLCTLALLSACTEKRAPDTPGIPKPKATHVSTPAPANMPLPAAQVAAFKQPLA